MHKIFWDKDNIGVICNKLNAVNHSHCILQIFLSFDAPMEIIVGERCISGKCVIINKNVPHSVVSNEQMRLSIFIEPTANLSHQLAKKLIGDYLICDKENIAEIQRKAVELISASQNIYQSFINNLIDYLGLKIAHPILDERIKQTMNLLKDCDFYDHTIKYFSDKVALSPSRLSHLFREQIGVPLKSYIILHQLEKAFTALFDGKNITDAAMIAGFDSSSPFAATTKKWLGMPVSISIKDSEFLKAII